MKRIIAFILIILSAWAVFEITAASDSDQLPILTDTDPYAAYTSLSSPAADTPQGDASRPGRIVVSKQSMTLTLFDTDGRVICRFPIACGRNLGNKSRVGDMKTPEGDFTVQQIQPSSTWTHDFGDGKGEIKGCYGNWFIRLKTPPHTGIGIHGTHDPSSIGTRATEGCIRLHNADLDSLKPMVRVGMPVRIETSEADRKQDGKRYETVNDTPQTSTADDADALWHTVASGDTASAIAAHYGIRLARLKELNPDIANIDRLSLGQRIRVR
ncbi:MAG: L,D-transpeptidase family protein [Alistipes sp.]|nr:L,D-transpeptidase family protein [Alistipes sp.]